MMRKTIKKSLYEVIGRGKLRPFIDNKLEKGPEPKKTDVLPVEEPSETSLKSTSAWPKRAKMLQILDGRLETSVPYTVVIAFALGCILIFLVFFRLGQLYEQKRSIPGISTTKSPNSQMAESISIGEGSGVIYNTSRLQGELLSAEQESDSEQAAGANHIVIMQYHTQKDLEPVKKYFDENGIDTEIEQRGDIYFLVTQKDTYNNPNKEGTDGYAARQEIKEIGAGYAAPPGYEKFVFKDPYGEKVQ